MNVDNNNRYSSVMVSYHCTPRTRQEVSWSAGCPSDQMLVGSCSKPSKAFRRIPLADDLSTLSWVHIHSHQDPDQKWICSFRSTVDQHWSLSQSKDWQVSREDHVKHRSLQRALHDDENYRNDIAEVKKKKRLSGRAPCLLEWLTTLSIDTIR